MTKKLIVVSFLIFIVSSGFTAYAENDTYDTYYKEIYDRLEETVDSEIWDKIENFGLNNFASDKVYLNSFNEIGEYFKSCLWDKISNVRESFFNILLVLIFSSALKAFFLSERSNQISLLSVAVIILILTANINSTVNGIISSMKTGATFMLAFIPVYTVVISLSGNISSALSYNTLTVLFAQGISVFINYYAVDIIGVYFSVSIALSFNNVLNLNRFVIGVSKLINTVIGFIAGVFTAILSFRGILSVSVDSASAKGIRFLLGSLIPVVGSSISDAYSSVIGSFGLIKGSVASIGIVAMLLISLPAIIEGGVFCLTFSILSYFAEMLNDNESSAALRAVTAGLKFIVILSVLQVFILIISTGLMLLIRGDA